ncbi:MAG: ChbG/HpnK family deacetylase [Beijerinckiaceae bacterium]
MLRFALCADDYALTPAVSRGILEALAARRLTAVSVMTTQPGWASAAGDLQDLAPQSDIGLHLNLTLGAPLGAMPGLAPSGAFPSLRRLVAAALLRRLPAAEIIAEIGRQIDAFAELLGRLPDHIDGHQHVHVLPGIRDWLMAVLAERGLSGRVWLRDPGDRPGAILSRPAKPKALAVAALAARFAGDARSRGFQLNHGFAGFSRFDPGTDFAASFASFLRAPGARHLVMCHPGHVDAALEQLDPATASRELELGFLLSARFADILAESDAELVRLSEEVASLIPT